MVRRGVDKLREQEEDRGRNAIFEPIFDAIYPLSDEEFLELVEEIAFVYGYQHLGTEDSFGRLCARVDAGVRAARAILERDVGD